MLSRKFLVCWVFTLATVQIVPSTEAAQTNSLKITIKSEGWMEFSGATKEEVSSTRRCEGGPGSQLQKLSRDLLSRVLRVRNENNKVIGISKVKWKLVNYREWPESPIPEGRHLVDCVLTAKLKKLNKSKFYQIQFGTEDAGVYSFNELNAKKWKLVFDFD